jgi:hypothetical protein
VTEDNKVIKLKFGLGDKVYVLAPKNKDGTEGEIVIHETRIHKVNVMLSNRRGKNFNGEQYLYSLRGIVGEFEPHQISNTIQGLMAQVSEPERIVRL